jgi:hypothetical protein
LSVAITCQDGMQVPDDPSVILNNRRPIESCYYRLQPGRLLPKSMIQFEWISAWNICDHLHPGSGHEGCASSSLGQHEPLKVHEEFYR